MFFFSFKDNLRHSFSFHSPAEATSLFFPTQKKSNEYFCKVIETIDLKLFCFSACSNELKCSYITFGLV